ncbi:PREDICTED: protein TIC 20-IV, chloroplastic-like [Camelina sativa]|uniref:Protein TIC 20 n=1 Tax=Camelina sativa TaxID=90675 RepID=A0ABM0VIZ3_CAMSA|nr:PREDICTED: protein TIC 20-IV, chloroplastic-like [Camelina sativa]
MQGLAATTDRGSLTYLAFRGQSPYLKKYVKPTRVYFSNFGPFPKLSSSPQRPIVPLLANAHLDFASSSNQLLGHGLPPLADLGARRNLRQRKPVTVKAYYKDENISRFRLPKTEERPEWFWMIMACVPYLISLKMSEIGFYMKPFLQRHGCAIGETIINLLPGAAQNLQHKFFMVYCVLGFAWVVKNRNLPHYFRYHMIMGILVETAMQIIWSTSEFFPLINFNGRLAIHYHMVMGFSFFCVLLECLRCALAGAYPQIPILSDAAYIHTRLNLADWPEPLRFLKHKPRRSTT